MDVLITEGSRECSFSLPSEGFAIIVDPTGKVGKLVTTALLEGQNGRCSASHGSTSLLLKNVPPTVLSITPILKFPSDKSVADYLQLTPLLKALSRRKGEERCSSCGGEIREVTSTLITEILIQEFSSKLIAITGRASDVSSKGVPSQRLVVDGREIDLDDPDVEADHISPPFDVIIDRLKVADTSLPRLSSAVERGFAMSEQVRIYPYPVASPPRIFTKGRSCILCGTKAEGELFIGKGSALSSLLNESIEGALAEVEALPSDPVVKFISEILTHCSSLNLHSIPLSTSLSDLSLEQQHLLAIALLVQPGLDGVLYFISDVLRHLHSDDLNRVASFFQSLESCSVLGVNAKQAVGAVHLEVVKEPRTASPPAKPVREVTRKIVGMGYEIEVPSLLGITGPAGSGKRASARAIAGAHGSSFEKVTEEWYVSGKAGRSFVGQYLKIWEPLTKLYTKLPLAVMRGVTAKELRPRYEEEKVTLGEVYGDLRFRGLSLSGLLSLSIAEALDVLRNHRECEKALASALGLGLGELALGTTLDHLTQGELQRLRLYRRVSKPVRNELIIFDLPSSGLPDDEASLIGGKLSEIVGAGSLIIVIDHEKALLDWCDRVIVSPPPSL